MKNRSVILDLVRILSVVAVVGVHILQTIGSQFGGFIGLRGFYFVSMGGAAVTVLIVLSGLVLGLLYKGHQLRYWSFLVKRLLRLYPPYYLILVIGVITYFIRDYFGVDPHDTLTLADIPLSFFAMYAFVDKWGGPFVGTSWFIGVIVCLYTIYPFIGSLLQKKPHRTLITLLLISVCSRLVLGQLEILPKRPLDWFPLCRIFEFGLGIYLAKKIPENFWELLNGNRLVDRVSRYASELTFPLFLVHWPIIHTLKHMHVPDFGWITLSLVTSIVVSAGIYEIDRRIFTPFIRRKISL